MGKMTLQDVACEAGVSLATVDRVINGRPGVHSRTIERVQTAIKTLNFHPDRHASRLARGRDYHFQVILPFGENDFMKLLETELLATDARLRQERVHISLQQVDVFDGPALATALEALPPDLDGVALVALDHPAVVEAVNTLVDAGVTVLTLVSDLPSSRRSHFVGIDNVAAGRTAANLIGRFVRKPGKVGLIGGSLALRDHIERQYGFEQVIASEFPDLQVLPLREGRDENARVEAAAKALLTDHPDLVAIYSVGGGQSGVVSALEASGRAKEVVFIAHELTPLARRHLIRGTIDAIINQDSGHMARSVARVLLSTCEGDPIVPGQERIRIDVFLRDNLP